MCLFVPVGKYQPLEHLDVDLTCTDCPSGRWYVDDDGQDKKYHDEESDCKQCPIGFEFNTSTTPCQICQAGRYQDDGATDDLECKLCPKNTFLEDDRAIASDHSRETNCIKCQGDSSSAKGASKCTFPDAIPIPQGVKVLRHADRALNVSWSYKENDVIPSGSTVQIQLSVDRLFLNTDLERDAIIPALPGTFIATNLTHPIWKTVYYVRIRTEVDSNYGVFSTTTEKWTIGKDCSSDESFLNETMSNDPTRWFCQDCPVGGYCTGAVRYQSMVPTFGYASCPINASVRFAACAFQPACLGGQNRNFVGKFKNEDGSDPSKCQVDEINSNNCTIGCHSAYRNDSKLCGACATGYSLADLSGKCDVCPEPGTNTAIALLGGVCGLLGIIVYVKLTLSDGGIVEAADGIMSITLSFIQLVSLLTTFPIAWPQIFVALFQVGGAVTVLGQHLVK